MEVIHQRPRDTLTNAVRNYMIKKYGEEMLWSLEGIYNNLVSDEYHSDPEGFSMWLWDRGYLPRANKIDRDGNVIANEYEEE